jgi:protein-tyrosine phosphatase
MPRIILFLCTGNYYRSRFAEILLNARIDPASGYRAASRGLKIGWPGNVGPLSPFAEQRLAQLNIASTGDRRMPLQCRECDLAEAFAVIAMKEAEHRAMIADSFPDWAGRVRYWHVHDVDAAAPDAALAEIERRVETLIMELTTSRTIDGPAGHPNL